MDYYQREEYRTFIVYSTWKLFKKLIKILPNSDSSRRLKHNIFRDLPWWVRLLERDDERRIEILVKYISHYRGEALQGKPELIKMHLSTYSMSELLNAHGLLDDSNAKAYNEVCWGIRDSLFPWTYQLPSWRASKSFDSLPTETLDKAIEFLVSQGFAWLWD